MGTALTRVPLLRLRWRACHAHHCSAVRLPCTADSATTAHCRAVYLTAAIPMVKACASLLLTPFPRGTTLTRVPLVRLHWRTCHAHLSSAMWLPRAAAGATTAHGRAVCLTALTPIMRASASPLLTLSPWAPLSHSCPCCDFAAELATRITPLQCGCRVQRPVPPLLTVALCASQPRPPR